MQKLGDFIYVKEESEVIIDDYTHVKVETDVSSLSDDNCVSPHIIWIKEEIHRSEDERSADSDIGAYRKQANKDSWFTNSFSCYHCGKVFNSYNSIRYHITIMHLRRVRNVKKKKGIPKSTTVVAQLNETVFHCTLCDHKAGSYTCLKGHFATHHIKERQYSCSFCSYRTKHTGTLNRHIMSRHTNHRPYHCTYCDYCTADSSTLKRHIMTKHTLERPYQCIQCDYKTVGPGNLKRHILSVHTDEKPYNCGMCRYNTADPGSLRKHLIARHTDMRPYQCSLCSYKSAHNSALKSHMLAKHRALKMVLTAGPKRRQHKGGGTSGNYSCHHCGKVYKRYISLELHIKLLHIRHLGRERKFKKRA